MRGHHSNMLDDTLTAGRRQADITYVSAYQIRGLCAVLCCDRRGEAVRYKPRDPPGVRIEASSNAPQTSPAFSTE
jgi:hypothetical protein